MFQNSGAEQFGLKSCDLDLTTTSSTWANSMRKGTEFQKQIQNPKVFIPLKRF
jgi:hypothetical protein